MFPLSIKDYFLIAAFIVLIFLGWKLYHAGADNAAAKITSNSLTEAATVKEKQNEIQKPSDTADIKRLRKHKY